MNCPKCKAEQPDNAKFCSQCAASLAESGQNVVVKSKMPTWLAIVLVLFLAFIGANVWNRTQQNERLNASRNRTVPVVIPPQPQPHAVNLTNGAATVNSASFVWYKFTIPENVTSVAINGHFTATGGTGNDIDCFVLDEDGFANFKNGHSAKTYYNSGRVTQAKIELRNLPTGTYYIMLDNRFSLFTPKAVEIQAELRYMQ